LNQQKVPLTAPLIPGVEVLWKLTKGDARVTIAVIDGPVDTSHPCFTGASLQSIPLWAGNSAGCQEAGVGSCLHGTQIASLIFAQHGPGPVRGIAPRCRGLIIPIFRDDPRMEGRVLPASQSTLAQAIDLAREHGAHIINISSGEPSTDNKAEAQLAAAVKRCADAGVLIVSAAGNDGCDCIHIPAALPHVLVVGALDATGKPSEYSNFGTLYHRQGILAPGENLAVATPGGSYTTQSGTSFAAPLVAGVAALLLSLSKSKSANGNQRLNGLYIRNLILQSAQPCKLADRTACRRYLAGTLDSNKALDLLKQGEPIMADQTLTNKIADTSPATDETSNGLEAQTISATEGGNYNANLDAWQSYTESVQPEPVSTSRCNPEPAPPMRERTVAPTYTARPASRVTPSGAGGKCAACEGNAEGNNAVQLVYALGEVGFDFGTQARLDAIAAEIAQLKADGVIPSENGPVTGGTLLSPTVSTFDLLGYFDARPWVAASIIWTLNLDAMPIYAVRAKGPYAAETYAILLNFLKEQLDPETRADRVSVPGIIAGSVRLSSGQPVPVIIPEPRGMYNWKTRVLVEAVAGKPADTDEYRAKTEGMTNFLNRVYYEIRNLGVDPRDRALNFAATNAFQISQIFESAAKNGLQLDQIEVVTSPICRPDSDCWDIVLYFFDPDNVLTVARRAYRFTADVSDIVPVLIGPFREWSVR
jgi:cyanobactin maturation PatA/PatG family protease